MAPIIFKHCSNAGPGAKAPKIPRLVQPIFCLSVFLSLGFWNVPLAYAVCDKPTVADNVMEALAQMDLDNSIEIVLVSNTYVLAKPKELPSGLPNQALWDSIRRDVKEAKQTGSAGHWLHDNCFMSQLFRNGIYSYRLFALPSLHAVFYFPGTPGTPYYLRFDNKVPYYIKLDMDRFPPGTTRFNSGRHFVIEVFPHWLMRGCTNQNRIAGQLKKNRLRDEVVQERSSNDLHRDTGSTLHCAEVQVERLDTVRAGRRREVKRDK